MPHLRLVSEVPVDGTGPEDEPVDDRPKVSLRLLMALSGRCSCDDCLRSYRAGNRRAGIVGMPATRALTAVR